jgi:ketosteroid isomerase-like protein
MEEGSMPRTTPICFRPLMLAAVLGLGFAAGWILREDGGGAEAQEDPTALATAQLTRFYDALAGRGELVGVLGQAFQIMRTDGTRYDRAGYLDRASSLSAYRLGNVHGVQAGDVLTATFFADATGTVGGAGVVTEGLPRLAVFTREGGDWKMQGFANLGNGLTSDPVEAGRKAVDAWVGAVASGDPANVAKVIAPEFQIVRSDGTAYDAAAYLQSNLPRFPEPPQIGTLVVTGFGDHIVARYEITSKVMLGEETEMRDAPRLTVFRKGADGTWLVVAHSNFAALQQ